MSTTLSLTCFRCGKPHLNGTAAGLNIAIHAGTIIAGKRPGQYAAKACKSPADADAASHFRATAFAANGTILAAVGLTTGKDGQLVAGDHKAAPKSDAPQSAAASPAPTVSGKVEPAAAYLARVAPDLLAQLPNDGAMLESAAAHLASKRGDRQVSEPVKVADVAPQPAASSPPAGKPQRKASTAPAPQPVATIAPDIAAAFSIPPAAVNVSPQVTPGDRTVAIPRDVLTVILAGTFSPAQLASMVLAGKGPALRLMVGDVAVGVHVDD